MTAFLTTYNIRCETDKIACFRGIFSTQKEKKNMAKPVVLVVMDGVGWTDKDNGNAVLHSYKPQIDELMTK